MVQQLIKNAKARYPLSIQYTGRLSENDIAALEKSCDVKCPSVYMNGNITYNIRYKNKNFERL